MSLVLLEPLADRQLVVNISRAAAKEGCNTFIVGGAARDLIRGQKPKDTDVLLSAPSTEIAEKILTNTEGIVSLDLVGKSFGVFKAKFDNGVILDVAIPRTEKSTGEGHKDFAITTGVSVVEDLARRDFTMNAIAIQVTEDSLFGEVLNPFKGIEDIRHGIICTVGDARERFTEDPLRMLRAFRFMSRFGYTFSSLTAWGIKDNQHLLYTVSPDRMGQEFAGILVGKNAPDTVELMSNLGVLSILIPEWEASRGFEQHNPHHYATVDQHVLDAFRATCRVTDKLIPRLAVLLHDISKPTTFKFREK